MLDLYPTKTFSQIFEEEDDFLSDFSASPVASCMDSEMVKLTYFLLFAKYGNSPIANQSESQFKAKVFATMFQYGPTWVKRLDVQEKLRNLSDEELRAGGRSVRNHAFNPSTEPSTSSIEELNFVDDQTTSGYKRSKLEAYSNLMDLLSTDVTEDYVRRFAPLFSVAIAPTRNIYVTEED